jgi:hypothetical protein
MAGNDPVLSEANERADVKILFLCIHSDVVARFK